MLVCLGYPTIQERFIQIFNLSWVCFVYTIFTHLNKSRCCKLFRYEDPPHMMLKLVIRNVHVIDLLCNICNAILICLQIQIKPWHKILNHFLLMSKPAHDALVADQKSEQ